MPELPEVEVIARDLRGLLVGKRFISVTVYWPGVIAHPPVEEFQKRIPGCAITNVGRRGKYLIIHLVNREKMFLLVHLRMTGRLFGEKTESPRKEHTHVIFELRAGEFKGQGKSVAEDHLWLHYVDPRKFGRFYLVSDPDEVVGSLGPEPLDPDFTSDVLGRALRRHSRRLKPLLLDQHFLAGLGNIYVDEALYAARLHPLRPANSLSMEEVQALHHAIVSVLQRAIANRGTTLSDYRDGQGKPGVNQFYLRVFQREGRPCPRCGTEITRIVVEGRGTYLCPSCQKPQVFSE